VLQSAQRSLQEHGDDCRYARFLGEQFSESEFVFSVHILQSTVSVAEVVVVVWLCFLLEWFL
jgi:hypothetical protein